MWMQKEITLAPKARGFHLITREILRQLPELEDMRIGMMNVFLKHTSASLTVNENADPAVRRDFERYFNILVPPNIPGMEHNDEGPDDLPAHLKTGILGSDLNIPISDGRLNLGVWQGIYLCEHRDHGGSRSIVVTMNGA
ncbi:YjbQ family protein [Candidimonas sp. SYP-B2681]|uniref:secondary thiamine-phosphate synthase enzyme YjbQ n=1 Tax=Candidimonas sp. SYP-B2681 TaxID=2497686 RepID=UPI000F886081|nr:secondary thiamine-phosphate synthase enzyme YjbQ [Candidimonas sp. SYP-B2681]RTZ43416.1 YjbQ family protein [Candidimonas sp. SYP-B2681]